MISLQQLSNLMNAEDPSLCMKGARGLSIFISRLPVRNIDGKRVYSFMETGKSILEKKKITPIENDNEQFKNQFIVEHYIRKKNGKVRKIVSYEKYLLDRLTAISQVFKKFLHKDVLGLMVGSMPGTKIPDLAKEFSANMSPKSIIGHLDIKDWFGSIKFRHVLEAMSKYFEPKAAIVVSEMMTYRGNLPQGAPTSPTIANIVASQTWGPEVGKYLEDNHLFGKFYLDDLNIVGSDVASTKTHLEAIEKIINKWGFKCHKKYTLSPGQRQSILGVVVNKPFDPRVSRRYRRRIRAIINKGEKMMAAGEDRLPILLEWASRYDIKPTGEEKVYDPDNKYQILFLRKRFFSWIIGEANWVVANDPKREFFIDLIKKVFNYRYI